MKITFLNHASFIIETNKFKICIDPYLFGSAFIKGCKLAIVIGADISKSDVWVEDCSIAATLIQMEAEDLELGSCWVQIRLRQSSQENQSSTEFVKEALRIDDENIEIASLEPLFCAWIGK